MAAALEEKLQRNIESIKKNILFNHEVRGFLQERISDQAAKKILDQSPESADWRIIEHHATISRLYSLYESFIFDTLRNWLEALPKLSRYTDLGEEFHKNHRAGVSKLLQKYEYLQNQNINEVTIIQNYYSSLSSADNYSIEPEAFCFSEANLWYDTLTKIVNNATTKDSTSWISNHPILKKTLEDYSPGGTVKRTLDKFIETRNEASHTTITLPLGKDDLLFHIEFISKLCNAVLEFIQKQKIEHYLNKSIAKK
jgi:hypothetical protein